ncbi:MAG: CheY-like chemotaxis protein [Polaribacter sp.]|jgi:CheY-like chemotaxis protein
MQQKYSICFIDDDMVYKFFMKGVLNKKKLADSVITFADGEEAFDFIDKNKEKPENLPDLIFLDINMPIMDGFQFMDEYMKIHASIKKQITIYMVTSSIDSIDLERSRQYSEISDFITKPTNVSTIEEIIHRLRE